MMKIFRSDLNNTNLLFSNEISAFAEDFKENIWIGTNEGLNILNKNNYTIKPHPDSLLKNKNIGTIINAFDSTVWVGFNNGLKRYNPDYTLNTDYSHYTNKSNALPNSSINQIYEDSYQNIWICMWDNGLYKFNKESNRFIKYPKIGKHDNPFRVFQDSNNNYWVGTWDEGMYLFNPNSFSKETYKKISNPDWESNHNNSRYFSFIQDNYNGYIWAMSLSGLSTYMYNNLGIIEPVNTRNLFQKTNNIFSEIIKDKNGNLWIGAFSEGIYKIDFNKPVIDNFPIPLLQKKSDIAPSFTSLCEDKDGDIWINQNRIGLFIYNPVKNKITNYNEIKELKNIGELNAVSYINYISGLDEIWITNSHNSKVIIIKKEGDNIKYVKDINLSNVTENAGIASLSYEDNQSNIWLASDRTLFIQLYGSDKIIPVKKGLGFINSISQDNNTLWLSTENNGIYKIHIPQELEETQVSKLKIENIKIDIIKDHIQSLTADLSGTVWIGKKDGSLIAYNSSAKTFTNKTYDCGLNGEAILDIISDKYNNIWITTYKKVIEYNPKNNASISYSALDGKQINSHLKNSLFKTKDSKYIYIGGNRGYSRFTPSEHLLAPPQETNVKITDIKIQNESILTPDKIEKFYKKKIL